MIYLKQIFLIVFRWCLPRIFRGRLPQASSAAVFRGCLPRTTKRSNCLRLISILQYYNMTIP